MPLEIKSGQKPEYSASDSSCILTFFLNPQFFFNLDVCRHNIRSPGRLKVAMKSSKISRKSRNFCLDQSAEKTIVETCIQVILSKRNTSMEHYVIVPPKNVRLIWNSISCSTQISRSVKSLFNYVNTGNLKNNWIYPCCAWWSFWNLCHFFSYL